MSGAADDIIALPGLRVRGTSASERRAALLAASDADLADAVVAAMRARAATSGGIAALARAVSLPLGEVTASWFGMRTVALAAQEGCACVHHELRAPLEWPEAICADEAVALDDEPLQWERGVLSFSKYRAFLQDEPFAGFNPNHAAKWGPHELAHRWIGAFWRGDATAWEHYVGARLNELVPVVLWYGPDEVARLDGRGFDRMRDAVDRTARADDALWMRDDENAAQLVVASIAGLRRGVAHFERELDAIDREIAGGLRVPTPADGLDGSSDALAYCAAHLRRLRSASFEGFAARVMLPNVGLVASGYTPQVRAYRDRVEAAFDTLCFGDIAVSPTRCASRVAARVVWDVAHRAAHAVATPSAALDGALSIAGEALGMAWRGDATAVEGAVRGVLAALPPATRDTVATTGLRPGSPAHHLIDSPAARRTSAGLVADGVASLAPACAAGLRVVAADALAAWVASDAPWTREPLDQRLAATFAAAPASLRACWAFERALAAAVERDFDVEVFDDEPADAKAYAASVVVASAAFRLHRFEADAAPIHERWATSSRFRAASLVDAPRVALVGAVGDGVAYIAVDEAVAKLWSALSAAPVAYPAAEALLDAALSANGVTAELPATGAAWLDELLGASAIRLAWPTA